MDILPATKMLIRTLLLLGLLLGPARGDEARDTEAAPAPSGPSAPVAYGLALGGTLVPILAMVGEASDEAGSGSAPLLFAGLALGPSLGQFYARSPFQGLAGASLRAAGTLLFAYGMQEVFRGFGCGATFGGEEEECEQGSDWGGVAVFAGTGMVLGGTLYSIVDAGQAVARWRRRQRIAWAWSLDPILKAAPGGAWDPGLRASLRF